MLRLQAVQADDRELLWNINQKYLYEMTCFYDDPMDANGNFHYGHFDEYFIDPKRVAYFIFNDDVLVGFAMLCPYSNIGQDPDYTMAEFTIFPSFRRKHFALAAAKMLLAKHPGAWEIKYNEKNNAAKKLWNIVAEPYNPKVHHLNEEETVLSFTAAPGKAIEDEKFISTERLYLRKMNPDDYDALYAILADSDIMQHYPHTFDEERVQAWIMRNMDRYQKDGFGLWAVCLKDTDEMIGDCGLTLQNISGETLPEIGYHIRKDHQRMGYAKEAASAVRDWAFRNTDYPMLYSYCKYTNEPSYKTAEAIGMRFECKYPDEDNGITYVSSIRREDWENLSEE